MAMNAEERYEYKAGDGRRAGIPSLNVRRSRFPANAVVCLSDRRVVNDEMGTRRNRQGNRTLAGGAYNASRVTAQELRVHLQRWFVALILTAAGVTTLGFGVDY